MYRTYVFSLVAKIFHINISNKYSLSASFKFHANVYRAVEYVYILQYIIKLCKLCYILQSWTLSNDLRSQGPIFDIISSKSLIQ